MLKKFGIPVILCVIVILTGCDQGQNMMKPVTTGILMVEPSEIEPSDETLTIDFTPELETFIPPESLLESDEIEHATEPHELVFETARQAVKDQRVQEYFKEAEKRFEEYCKTRIDQLSNLLVISFTSREERQKFIDALPSKGVTPQLTWVRLVNKTNIYFIVEVAEFFECE